MLTENELIEECKKTFPKSLLQENDFDKLLNSPELKDNKNGNIAIVFSVIACILLDVIIGIIVLAFTSNVAIGLFSIFLLFIPSWLQNLAVKKAKKQLNINGNGRIKLILVKYIFPIIAVMTVIIVE